MAVTGERRRRGVWGGVWGHWQSSVHRALLEHELTVRATQVRVQRKRIEVEREVGHVPTKIGLTCHSIGRIA
jgi:hypothetical protein